MPEGLEGRIRTRSAHRFRSEGERRIGATLDQYGIPFVYEQKVPVHDKGKVRTLRPDFYLPEFNLYIEYYGRVGNPDYDLRTQRKQEAYHANGIKVLPIYPWDLCQDWPGHLLDKLRYPGRTRGEPPKYTAPGIGRAYNRCTAAPYGGSRHKSYR